MTEGPLWTLSFDIASLHQAYAASVTPTDIVAEVYRRIRAVADPGIFIHLRPEAEVLTEARHLGRFDADSPPLWGVPFAVKDNIDLGNVPTSAACPAFAYTPETDAFVVTELRLAGALAIGKTNLDQFATGLVGVRSPFPPPRNSIDPLIVPGGSSSGSAVAVGHGIVSFALGTDTAGSGRVPAALNNIVGLKPSLGALSASGVVPACRTLDTISIFAMTVPDAWQVFRVAAVYDGEDAYAKPIALPSLGSVPPNLRVGVPNSATREFFGDEVQAGSFAVSVERLQALGAQVVEVDFTPFFDVAKMLYEGAWVAERMTVVQDLMRRDPRALHPVTAKIIGAADRLSATDAFRGIYRLAELKRLAEPVLARVDLLCVPTIPTFYSLTDLADDPVGPNSRLGTYTNFVNLLDLCGVAVPVAPRSDGRPGSVTLLAPAGKDALSAGVAEWLHQDAAPSLGATGFVLPKHRNPLPLPMPGESVLAVVGAHMSGLPLNCQLAGRGGRFLEATTTASLYRLFLLDGGPPYRPGLLRVGEGGQAVALELWALPETAFGAFIAGVPSPLAIGTVELADGRKVLGFQVEEIATRAARDISRYGGWRAFIASDERPAG